MSITPWPSQVADLAVIREADYNALLAIEPGGGKTILSALVVKDANPDVVLISAPNSTIEGPQSVWQKTIAEVSDREVRLIGNKSKASRIAMTDFELGYSGVYAMTPQLFSRKSTLTGAWEGDMFIADECFVSGTLVDTPQGPRPIESLKEGDEVFGFDHTSETITLTRVRGTMEQMSDTVLPGGSTPNHPYYVVDEGYYPVADIEDTDYVYQRVGKSVRRVPATILRDQEAPPDQDLRVSMWVCAAQEAHRGENVSRVQKGLYPRHIAPQDAGMLQSHVFGQDQESAPYQEGYPGVCSLRARVSSEAFREDENLFSNVCGGVNCTRTEKGTCGEAMPPLRVSNGATGILEKEVLQSSVRLNRNQHDVRNLVTPGVSGGHVETDDETVVASGISRGYVETDDREQPIPGPARAGENKADDSGEGVHLRSSEWREWAHKPLRVEALRSVASRMGHVTHRINRRFGEVFGITEPLQTGHSAPGAEGLYRGGRDITQGQKGPGSGQKERSISFTSGLDPLEVHQPRSYERYSRVCDESRGDVEVPVFNLETGSSNYFVNGILVHNCHGLTTAGKSGQRKWSGYDLSKDSPINLRFPSKLALSGTPMRQDFANMWATMRFLWPQLSKRDEVAYFNYYVWMQDRMTSKQVYTSNKDADGNYKKVTQYLTETEPGKLLSEMPCVIVHKRRENCCEYHPTGFMDTEAPNEIEIEVELTTKQKKAIHELETHMMTYLEEHPLITEMTMIQKMRVKQLCLGEAQAETYWGLNSKDEEVEKTRIEYEVDCKSPFAEAAFEILDELPRDEAVLVLLESQRFASVFTAKLNARGIAAREYSGKTKADLYRLGTDYRVLVGVIAAIGSGTNGLQDNCNTEIYLETPGSLTNETQVNARLDRPGGKQVQRFIIHDTQGYSRGRYSRLLEKKLHVSASLRVDLSGDKD